MTRLIFSKPYFIAMLLAVFLLPTAGNTVGAQTLTPSEIAAFRTQLAKAQAVDAALTSQGQCYSDKEGSLEKISLQLQQTAGELHQQKQKLAPELERAKYEAEAFSRDYDKAQQEVWEWRDKIEQITRRIRAREAKLRECKRKFGFFGFACDWAAEIAGLNSELRDLTAKKSEAEIRFRGREERFYKAKAEFAQAKEKLRKIGAASDKNKTDIVATEEKITVVKSSLSEIRALKQDYATLRDGLTASLVEFERLDPASDRQAVTRRLRRESEELKALLDRAQRLLASNGLLLPGGERICAN